MTVGYTYNIATTSFVRQWNILLYWKGSIWKAVIPEMIVWIAIFTTLSCIYRCCLTDSQRETFEKVVILCNTLNDRIPLTFMLGFYVTNVASRWWSIITNIGFTDNLILMAESYVSETNENARLVKRSLIRYMCLTQLLVYRTCSKSIAKLYPTRTSLLNAGYLEESEMEYIQDEVFWIPLSWAMSLVAEAREQGMIRSDRAVQQIYQALTDFYKSQLTLTVYNWITVPLGYTQVAFMTVRCYFLVAAVGRQYIHSSQDIDLYIPFQTIFQMILYIGWLAVAEAMLCPFGKDDDDFDCSWWINRNFSKGIKMLYESTKKPPPLMKLEEEESLGESSASTKSAH